MTEPHFTLPKVRIEFAGKERFLCFTNRSLRRLRDEKKVDAIEVFQKGEVLDTLPLLLWTGFLWAEPELGFGEIENYFLDYGGIIQNKNWAMDITEALIGERPKEKHSDPPPADGEKS
jgi:hypothetical protein